VSHGRHSGADVETGAGTTTGGDQLEHAPTAT
jgi:hypothetical protein